MVRGLEILHNVMVSDYVILYQPNLHFIVEYHVSLPICLTVFPLVKEKK